MYGKAMSETKDKLMETAIALIWESNYSNVGVAEICKQAGVTKGSFYHYFESKADLFYQASHHHWKVIQQDLDTIYAPKFSPVEQLENLIDYIIGKQKEKSFTDNPVSGCPFFTSGGQVGSGEEKVRLAAQEMADKAIQYNRSLIAHLQSANILADHTDSEQLSRMIYHYIMGILLYGRVMHSLRAVEQDLRPALYRLLNVKPEYRK